MTATLAKIVWLALNIAFRVVRMGPRARSGTTPIQQTRRDLREVVLLLCSLSGLGVLPLVHVATDFPAFANYPMFPGQGFVGLALGLGALWWFVRIHRDLGANWSVSLDVRRDHSLVTTGVYSRVRHPMYAAFFLMGLAQLFLLSNWIAGPAGLVGFGVLYLGRVAREEAMMIDAFGDDYVAYMRRTARIIPWIH